MLSDHERKQNEQGMVAVNSAIAEVARREGKTVEEVRAAITEAIEQASSTQDPEIQARWALIPRKGTTPSPEEFIIWAVEMLSYFYPAGQ